MRWRDYSLKSLEMPKSVFKIPQKFKANPPMKFRFFFFFVKSAPIVVTLFLYKGFLRGFLRLV
ncbi:hypothetical protein AOD82_0205520 [Helicobacter pylori]|nr:hypothetical protein AOD82_0205520 [Helicobacter pylori]